MFEAVGVEEESGISDESKLGVGLCLKVVTPGEHSNACIEGANHHNFFPVFQEVDLVEIVHCL